MKLVFATWAVAEYQGRVLTEQGAEHRLVSFWELLEKPPETLTVYCRDGKAGKPKATK